MLIRGGFYSYLCTWYQGFWTIFLATHISTPDRPIFKFFFSLVEKFYSKTTPTDKLADLLKRNHLADPALALVKSLDHIVEIWDRLLKAYGDPKIMLQMKLAELGKAGPLTKHKEPETLIECLFELQ